MHQRRENKTSAMSTWFSQEVLATKSVIVVGAGALGNWILPHLALNGVGHILIIDRDQIEECNLPRSPLYNDSDIGKPKAQVAAEKLRALNSQVSVDFIVGDIEWDVGLAHFKYTDCVLGAVDSRLARMLINSKAWITRTPYIDGAIDGQTLTGRVQTFIPQQGACLECAWYPDDYRLLERAYPCDGGAEQQHSAPTVSTIASVIGALQANEALKLLLRMEEHLRPGRELRWDILHHSYIETQVPRRSTCFLDHDFSIGETILLPKTVEQLSLGEIFDLTLQRLQGEVTLEFRRDLATVLVCERCGSVKRILRVVGRISSEELQCTCSGRLHPSRFTHSLKHEAAQPFLELTLAEIGIPSAEIISASDESDERFFEFPGAFNMKERQR